MALFAQAVEGVRIALGALRTNLLRTSLTTLGVVVGIAFVILMGWFLQGLDKALDDTISLFGNDVLYIDKFDWSGREDWNQMRNRKDITLSQAEEVEQLLTTPQAVVPTIRRQGIQVKRENHKVSNTIMFGTLSTYAPLLGDQVAEGRFLSPIEDHFRQNVVVIGYALAESLFPGSDPIGQEVKIKGRNFRVIGVLKKRATFMFKEVDNEFYIPLKSFMSIFGGGSSLTIAVKAGGEDRMDEVRAETIGVMRRVRNLVPGQKEDFGLNEAQQFRDQIATLRLTVWSAGIGLTALSFIVGVIGIVNIMFVAVTERTKEIGIRKALGAPRRTILFQFLVESATLCLMGALVAFIFCSILMFIITTTFDWASFLPTFISPSLLFIATAVSIAVGIIAGIIPAFRAAKMDPVTALRFD
jgi:putative ABC transport system permease protein